MSRDPSVYDKLATYELNAATVTLLDTITKDTFVDSKNVEFWSGVITVARAIGESRTYAHGISIPEAGSIASSGAIDAAGSASFQPSGSEVWLIEGIEATGSGANTDVNILFFDGSASCAMHSATIGTDASSMMPYGKAPFPITNSLYLMVTNTSGGSQTVTVKIAYQKVSL